MKGDMKKATNDATDEKATGEQKIESGPSAVEIYGPALKCETIEAAAEFLASRIAAAQKDHPGITAPDAENLERYRIVNFARMWEPMHLERIGKLFGKKGN
jgi:hypothetical protein